MIEDMAADLGDYTVAEVEVAIRRYRLDASKRFFPRAAELLALMPRAVAETPTNPAAFEFGDSRPSGWEYSRKRYWKPHWRAEDLKAARDEHRYQRYCDWLDAVKAGKIVGVDAYEH